MSNYSIGQAYSLAAEISGKSMKGCKSAQRAASTFLKVAVDTGLTTIDGMAKYFGCGSPAHMRAKMRPDNLPAMNEVRSFARLLLEKR